MTLEQYFENPPLWVFFAFFAALWWFVLTILARASGWTTLAEIYGDQLRLEGPRRRFQSMQMGRGATTNFGGVITFTATPFALEISTFFPFDLTMKPLVIPLSDLTAAEAKWMFVLPAIELRAARAPDIVIRVAGPTASWIAEATGARHLSPG